MFMASVIIYGTLVCPYCVRAKELLDAKGVSYQEIRVDQNQDKLAEMLAKSNGRRSVPQIFINEQHIGGFDDLKALQDQGTLDAMLTSSSQT